MSALQQAADFAADPRLREPMTAAVVRAAVDIMAEQAATEGHELRVALAHYILLNPAGAWERFAWPLSTNATVVATWATGNIDGAVNDFPFAVASLWDAVAGVTES